MYLEKKGMVMCSKCGQLCPAEAVNVCLRDILQVLEPVANRADAHNSCICRAALKRKFGSKRARLLVDFMLEDRVIAATKTCSRRHVMMLDKQPLKLSAQEDGGCVHL